VGDAVPGAAGAPAASVEGGDQRLDAALPALGLARSRTHAARLIADGLVTVDGRGVVKASFRVMPGSAIAVAGTDKYVSRGAHKLVGALDAFPGVRVEGRRALDVGASTGGFTQVLLERGAWSRSTWATGSWTRSSARTPASTWSRASTCAT
jgi:23S rRNA (cytidine1920-2'-O)/16S rRNA (cytidine1409-2'-O)-methyltransferase